ncbi:hypothetical protein TRL7639_00340 [Falsiruegeria litorea R37]|uniref:Lipoprotein n=1 Tax=Falsiruegeria litorea R37 TaxID=1200284 RepID=A0A1Y5RGQ4_9RHOB|nr:hypothetical protein [Falsiruegeria litorea]SLN16987.1 hypothetical protein TRL7639_00340 [Falsiruegeria litorea R37]
MKLKFAALGLVAATLVACAQQEEIVPVTFAPTYDKLGNASCPEGYTLATTTAGATVCSPLS